MTSFKFYFLSILIVSATMGFSFRQRLSVFNLHVTGKFVGSTPCDKYIHSLLELTSPNLCEFMKWELDLDRKGANSFHLVVYYGETKPNTNWFRNDGEKLELKGTYTITRGIPANPKAKVYNLKTAKLASPILLIEMNANLFHFADAGKHFLIGNGGWGYALNKVQE